MRILVTGCTGMLGADLCLRLAGSHDLLGWARHPGPPLGAVCRKESVDLTDPEAVRRGMGRFQPQLVIHSAAMTDVDACEKDPAAAQRVNAEATGMLAASCAEAGAVLLAVSTDYVFSGESRAPYRETDPAGPVNAYGRSKLEGERLALERSSRVMVVRVSGLFGAARQNFVSLAARRLRMGEEVQAVEDQANSLSYTVDLADGIARLLVPLETDPNAVAGGGRLHGVFHLANEGGATRLAVAEEIARILGKPASLIRRTRWADLGRPARRPLQTILDNGRFSGIVGCRLRPWEAAVAAFLSN